MQTEKTEWDGLPIPKRYWAIVAIAMGVTVSVLDGTIANVALPSIAEDLKATPSMSIWIVNAYQLALVISLLSLSSLGDILGYRRIYIGGLIVFSVTSLACALVESLWALTVARIFQGFGAAALASVNTSLIRIIYPKRNLGQGLGINALVVAVSAAGGPTIAAGILAVTSWHWLFAINVPIVLIALFLAIKHLPNNTTNQTNRKFDWPSGLMNAFTFGLLIFSIDGFTRGWNPVGLTLLLIVAITIGYFFVRRQLTQPYPLLPVDLMKIPIFSLSVGTSVCSFIAQMLAMVSLPFLLQHTLKLNEVQTGLLLTPWPLATMIAAPLAGKLLERLHAGLLGGVGLFIFSTGLFLLAFLADKVSNTGIGLLMALCGFGFGLFQTPNNSVLISAAPSSRSGGASGMLGMARLTGQTTGASLVALLFALLPTQGTYAALYLAGGFAAIATVISFTRVALPEPEILQGGRKKQT